MLTKFLKVYLAVGCGFVAAQSPFDADFKLSRYTGAELDAAFKNLESPSEGLQKYGEKISCYLQEGWDVQHGFFRGENQTFSWYSFSDIDGSSPAKGLQDKLTVSKSFLKGRWTGQFYNKEAVSVISDLVEGKGGTLAQSPSLFPEGAAMVQIVWSDAASESTKNSLKQVFSLPATSGGKVELKELSLVTVNFAVRDSRVDGTGGWVFGCLGYQEDSRSDANPFGLVPLGLTWGNDPQLEQTSGKGEVKQSWIADIEGNREAIASEQGRLVGHGMPKSSSCISCHSTAQYEAVSFMLPPEQTSPENRAKWFRNLERGESFDRGRISLDFSLGLSNLLKQRNERKKAISPGKKERFTREPLAPDIYPE